MTRLIDALFGEDLSTKYKHLVYESPAANLSRSMIRDSEIIVADNCAHYYYGDVDTHEYIERWGMNDFPNIAPPFENCLIEWIIPRSFGYTFKGFVGAHFISEKKKMGWRSIIVIYAAIPMGYHIAGEAEILIGDNGEFISGSNLGIAPTLRAHLSTDLPSLDDNQSAYLFLSQNIFPAFLALSFMHCKNVELKTQIPPLPLSRKYEKKHGRPLVKYKVLEIEPMKKILCSDGQSGLHGLKYALHICRGHFKDYSKGGGLFGKYKGLYWWESHVRGDPSRGAVVKDYSIGNIDSNAIMH